LFSWLTADTGRSICISSSNRRIFTVYMHGLLADGSRVKFVEHNYEGYGCFGGKDFFVLLSQMNISVDIRMTEDDHRMHGLSLFFPRTIQINPSLVYPQLTETADDLPIAAFSNKGEQCPRQGCIYSDSENDDDET